MAITIKDIARKFNVSTAAVSMALNNKKGVSTSLKKKIIEYAKDNDYQFKNITKTEDGVKGTILFLVYRRASIQFIDSAFFQELSISIDVEANKSNYYNSIKYIYENGDLRKQLENAISLDVKGIIVLATEMEEKDLSIFNNIEIPIVLLDATFINCPYNSITQNNKQGVYLACSNLINKKNAQPGYLCTSVDIHNFRQRKEGFFSTLYKKGYSKNNSQTIPLSPTIDGSYSDMKEFLILNKLTNRCYFADNDMIALGAIKAIKEAGYMIPEDISICGFDNLPYSAYNDPSLTSIEPNKYAMGKLAIKRIIELINGDDVVTHNEVNVTLIKRNS